MASGIATGTKYFLKSQVQPSWYHIDAKNVIVGRLASQISVLLQGKQKPIFEKSELCGDFVVVTNAKEIQFTGKNWKRKIYRWHTGYIGGLKEMPAWRLRERHPERVLSKAVWGMLPKTKLKKNMMDRLKIFPTTEHNLDAQLVHASPLPDWFKLSYHDPTEVKHEGYPRGVPSVKIDEKGDIVAEFTEVEEDPKKIASRQKTAEYLAKPKKIPWYNYPPLVHDELERIAAKTAEASKEAPKEAPKEANKNEKKKK